MTKAQILSALALLCATGCPSSKASDDTDAAKNKTAKAAANITAVEVPRQGIGGEGGGTGGDGGTGGIHPKRHDNHTGGIGGIGGTGGILPPGHSHGTGGAGGACGSGSCG